MIDLAITALQQKLQTLPFLDLVGGIARQQKINVDGVVKTLPATPDPDNPDAYLWLTPNSERAGIAYFELLQSRPAEPISGGRYKYSAAVRCVVWLNTARLAPKGVAAQALATVASHLQGTYPDAPPVVGIRVWPIGEAPRGPELFAKYTYDEAENQFLMLPFDYFAFDFEVTFVVVSDCVVGNIIKTDASPC